MSYQVEIADGPLGRDRQAALAAILAPRLGVEPEEAELLALITPSTVGPVATAGAQAALVAAGFAARAVGQAAPPAPPASDPVPDGPAPDAAPRKSRAGLAAVLLALAVAGLAGVALASRPATTDTVIVDGPPGAGTDDGGGTTIEDGAPEEPPVDADLADFETYGYSPRRGVNWGVFASGSQTRYSSSPDGTPVPVRDAPSRRHGTALTDVPNGSTVETDGCLPARSDGGRWCRVDLGGSEGWVYDRFLTSAPQVPSDEAEFALGYSSRRGVNWNAFSSGVQVRYAAAPRRTPIPVRDAPSARHGRALADVSSGSAVRTDGCLPRRDDGGRWCRTDAVGGEGWIYDRFLADSPRQAPARAPARPAGADFALGYSPQQGVNWSVFESGRQVRTARAPGGSAVPVRDAPSREFGRVAGEVPSGGMVETNGCLPQRPEDGSRWCRVDLGGTEGWVYDRFLE